MLLRSIHVLALGTIAVITTSAVPAHAQWARCGGENGWCEMSNTGRNLVRFGKNPSWFYIEVQGTNKIPCNRFEMGDPALGEDKSCEYRATPPPASNEGWQWCGGENGACQMGYGTPRRVRYGDGTRWLYKTYS